MDERRLRRAVSEIKNYHAKDNWQKPTTSDGMFPKPGKDDFYCPNCGELSFKSTSVKQPNGKIFCSYCNRLQKAWDKNTTETINCSYCGRDYGCDCVRRLERDNKNFNSGLLP